MNTLKTNMTRTLLAVGLLTAAAHAQVGKSLGLIDLNTADEKSIAALPNATPELTKALLAARPFESITAVHTLLLANKLTPEQTAELYKKAFVHINLNIATKDEIMLIPGAGKKMAHEFDEYRPWKTWAQFDKEIGKYVGKEETARLAQYCFIPLDVNKATAEELATIPGASTAVIDQITKSRPWKSVDDLKKAVTKATGEKEAARIARFLVAS